MKNVLLLWIVVFLSSCSVSHDIEIENIDSIDVSFFEHKIQLDNEETISVTYSDKNHELTLFKEWLNANKDGWDLYLHTVPIGEIMISTESFSLQVGADFIILTPYSSNGRVLSRNGSTSEFKYFKKP